MVKKIRLIDDEKSEDEAEVSSDSSAVADSEFKELAKSMDWKLWEILQILQRFEKKLTVEEKDEKSKK